MVFAAIDVSCLSVCVLCRNGMGAFSTSNAAPSSNGVCGNGHDNGSSGVAHYQLRNGGLRAARKRGQAAEPSSEEGQQTVHSGRGHCK